MRKKVDDFVEPLAERPFLTSSRQRASIAAAITGLEGFYSAFENHEFEECLAFELQGVATSLAEVIGAVDHEDILDKVFADFCIGK